MPRVAHLPRRYLLYFNLKFQFRLPVCVLDPHKMKLPLRKINPIHGSALTFYVASSRNYVKSHNRRFAMNN